jgi:hypothetical protein
VARDWEQVTGQAAPTARRERPPRVRRMLKRGPRIQPTRGLRPSVGGQQPAEHAAAAQQQTLREWHDMSPGEQTAEWASLRAWVTWLYDRYELSVEDRLPRCWASHPGLVEELFALMAWREEIYCGSQPSGQAARYWHAELRQVLHAASAMYALGCRTGHRGAATLAANDPALLAEWAAADPVARVPGIDLAAGNVRRAGNLTPAAAVGAALDNGDAIPVPGAHDMILHAGNWLAPASAGWIEVPGPTRPGLPSEQSAAWLRPEAGGSNAEEAETTEGLPDPWKA